MAILHLVTLPIGNIHDITFRARKILEEETFFLTEDTRVFRSLLAILGIKATGKKIISFHDSSNPNKLSKIVAYLDQGDDLFLVSDAGSPIISDPAYPLVVRALESGHGVDSIPGVTSILVALELSGLPPTPFKFWGFLPREKGKKEEFFHSLSQNVGTHIFFEAPNRVMKSLDQIAQAMGDAQVVVCRELTKKFQSVYRLGPSELASLKEGDDPFPIVQKGEFVILVYIEKKGKGEHSLKDNQKLVDLASECVESGATPKTVAKILALILGKKSKDIYSQILRSGVS